MSEEFPQIIPTPPPPAEEIFAVYQITRDFYTEAQYREEFECYCQWYREVSELYRQEQQKIQGDINILGWFNRGRR